MNIEFNLKGDLGEYYKNITSQHIVNLYASFGKNEGNGTIAQSQIGSASYNPATGILTIPTYISTTNSSEWVNAGVTYTYDVLTIVYY